MSLFVISLWLACNQEQSAPVQVVRTPDTTSERTWPDADGPALDMTWFVRASLDVRGYRPSAEELQWANEHPDDLTALLDDWLVSEGFANQMAWYWNDLLHTSVWMGQEERFDRFALTDAERRAIGWEPLSYIEQTIREGRPFTDIVTMGSVPTNASLATLFADDVETEGDEWQLMFPGKGTSRSGGAGVSCAVDSSLCRYFEPQSRASQFLQHHLFVSGLFGTGCGL